METVIAGLSVFQYHRIPPRILQALDEPLDISTLSGRIGLGRREKFLLYLDTPLDVLVRSRSECHRSRGMNRILWEGALPSGAVWEVDAYLKVTSPAFTLFLLASRMNRYRLAMAMYELCGSFTVFKTLPQHFDLARTLVQLPKRLSDGWRPVVDERGNITELWRRPPLVTVEELCSMAGRVHGRKGYRAFTRTIDEIRGVAASPLEARAAMRLCGSRLYGGEGFGPVELNRRVAFSRAARAVTDGSCGFVDMFFEADGHHGDFGLECQGRAVHGPGAVTGADANRLLGLQIMGIDMALLTHEQLRDDYRFEQVRKMVAAKLGVTYREKTARQKRYERDLVDELFCNWGALGRRGG